MLRNELKAFSFSSKTPTLFPDVPSIVTLNVFPVNTAWATLASPISTIINVPNISANMHL